MGNLYPRRFFIYVSYPLVLATAFNIGTVSRQAVYWEKIRANIPTSLAAHVAYKSSRAVPMKTGLYRVQTSSHVLYGTAATARGAAGWLAGWLADWLDELSMP